MTPYFWEKNESGTIKHILPSYLFQEVRSEVWKLARARTIRRLGEHRKDEVHWRNYGYFLQLRVLPRLRRMQVRHQVSLIHDYLDR